MTTKLRELASALRLMQISAAFEAEITPKKYFASKLRKPAWTSGKTATASKPASSNRPFQTPNE